MRRSLAITLFAFLITIQATRAARPEPVQSTVKLSSGFSQTATAPLTVRDSSDGGTALVAEDWLIGSGTSLFAIARSVRTS